MYILELWSCYPSLTESHLQTKKNQVNVFYSSFRFMKLSFISRIHFSFLSPRSIKRPGLVLHKVIDFRSMKKKNLLIISNDKKTLLQLEWSKKRSGVGNLRSYDFLSLELNKHRLANQLSGMLQRKSMQPVVEFTNK